MKVVFGDTISTLIFDTLCAVDLDASPLALVIDSLFMSEFSILHGGLCFKLRPFHLLLESGDLSDLVQNKVWKFKKKWIDNFIIF